MADPYLCCPDYRQCVNQCGSGPCSRRCTVCHRMSFAGPDNGPPCPACPDHPPKKAEPPAFVHQTDDGRTYSSVGPNRGALPEDYMNSRWYAMPDDLIGGWCIMLSQDPPSRGGYGVGDFISEEAAKHVAQLHNTWLLGEVGTGG